MNIIAVDPGLEGAIAFYDASLGRLDVHDMPIQDGRLRKIVDENALFSLLQSIVDGATTKPVFFVEEVGGIPGQSAPAAFNFGAGYGGLRMAAVALGLPIEPVRPAIWKAAMKAPREKKASISRASELIPTHTHIWGPRAEGSQGQKSGRAEAAMIALYGERVLRGKI